MLKLLFTCYVVLVFLISEITASKACASLVEEPVLEFVSHPALLPPTHTSPLACARVFECNVLTSPPESTVYWYKEGKLVHAIISRDLTLRSPPSATMRPMLGISELKHRICVDQLVAAGDAKPFRLKCRVQSPCNPRNFLESEPVLIEPLEKGGNPGAAVATANRYYSAPLISLVSGSRLEVAGTFVQLYCNAVGVPKPEISWGVVDTEDDAVVYDVEGYPFIWTLTSGDLIIDTSKTTEASFTFKCTASNKFGRDEALSVLVIVDN